MTSRDPQGVVLEDLRVLERERQIRVLFAVESGSRAWRCSAPDSDYDARFVYVNDINWYLSLVGRPRDVIENPFDGRWALTPADEAVPMDLNGWELRKALSLLLKGNRTIADWLMSPIRYLWSGHADYLRELCDACYSPVVARYSYIGLLESTHQKYIHRKEQVRLKKYVYAIRPALALQWCRQRPEPPPVDFPSLRAGLDIPASLNRIIDDLLAERAAGEDEHAAPPIREVIAMIECELALARKVAPKGQTPDSYVPGYQHRRTAATALFRRVVHGL